MNPSNKHFPEIMFKSSLRLYFNMWFPTHSLQGNVFPIIKSTEDITHCFCICTIMYQSLTCTEDQLSSLPKRVLFFSYHQTCWKPASKNIRHTTGFYSACLSGLVRARGKCLFEVTSSTPTGITMFLFFYF